VIRWGYWIFFLFFSWFKFFLKRLFSQIHTITMQSEFSLQHCNVYKDTKNLTPSRDSNPGSSVLGEDAMTTMPRRQDGDIGFRVRLWPEKINVKIPMLYLDTRDVTVAEIYRKVDWYRRRKYEAGLSLKQVSTRILGEFLPECYVLHTSKKWYKVGIKFCYTSKKYSLV
jgi:hypothetical protein